MATVRVQVRRSFVAGVSATAAWTDLSFDRHSHDGFGIGVIGRGGQRSASGRGPVEALAGDVITVNPGEVHDGAPIDGPRGWRMLYLTPGLFSTAAHEAGIARGDLVAITRPVIQDTPLASAVARAYHAATQANADTWAREEAVLTVFAHLLARHTTGQPIRQPPPAVRRVLECLQDDPASEHSLSDLAALVGLSRFQLLRGVRRATGQSPHSLRQTLRVQRAQALIRAATPLAEAAVAAGFADQSHMTRAFVRVTGATPGAWAAALA